MKIVSSFNFYLGWDEKDKATIYFDNVNRITKVKNIWKTYNDADTF